MHSEREKYLIFDFDFCKIYGIRVCFILEANFLVNLKCLLVKCSFVQIVNTVEPLKTKSSLDQIKSLEGFPVKRGFRKWLNIFQE